MVTWLLMAACSASADEFQWLEEVDGEKALDWVKTQNKRTADVYAETDLFKSLYAEAIATLDNDSRLPSVDRKGKWVYDFWRDAEHPRGVYRRVAAKGLSKPEPKWETVLDMDQYNADHEGLWVFKGMSCLPPKHRKCLVRLSPGGGDSIVLREFDAHKKRFVDDGFALPNSKMNVSWVDEDHLFVATDFGPGSLTESGYPRTLKLWRRGTDLADAETLLSVDPKAISVYGFRARSAGGDIDLVGYGKTFWTQAYNWYTDGALKPLQLPETAVINGAYQGMLIVSLKDDWTFQGQDYSRGEVLVAAPAVWAGEKGTVHRLIKSEARVSVESLVATDKGILVNLLDNVRGRLCRYTLNKNGEWVLEHIRFPDNGTVNVVSVDGGSSDFYVQFESFIQPPTLYYVDADDLQPKVLRKQDDSFDASKYVVEQFTATSKDGTQVPYFLVRGKEVKFDGNNPVHIFSYGGFRNSLKPSYSGSYEQLSGAYGKLWLDRGGVFVSANIRGGGEFGPEWHQAALLKNRHKAFEDFEAVAEDLIQRKVTTGKRIGIEGRSNGGLLVGATMLRRPELYGAVICGVPLLDMQRYHKLLAGASWVAEYGNPEDASMWEYMQTYSPYQNLKAGQDYPKVFFYTSTRDDRVHPGHARKMAAKMASMGYPFWYYENMEGGHGGSSTNQQLARRLALAYTHLWTQLQP